VDFTVLCRLSALTVEPESGNLATYLANRIAKLALKLQCFIVKEACSGGKPDTPSSRRTHKVERIPRAVAQRKLAKS